MNHDRCCAVLAVLVGDETIDAGGKSLNDCGDVLCCGCGSGCE